MASLEAKLPGQVPAIESYSEAEVQMQAIIEDSTWDFDKARLVWLKSLKYYPPVAFKLIQRAHEYGHAIPLMADAVLYGEGEIKLYLPIHYFTAYGLQSVEIEDTDLFLATRDLHPDSIQFICQELAYLLVKNKALDYMFDDHSIHLSIWAQGIFFKYLFAMKMRPETFVSYLKGDVCRVDVLEELLRLGEKFQVDLSDWLTTQPQWVQDIAKMIRNDAPVSESILKKIKVLKDVTELSQAKIYIQELSILHYLNKRGLLEDRKEYPLACWAAFAVQHPDSTHALVLPQEMPTSFKDYLPKSVFDRPEDIMPLFEVFALKYDRVSMVKSLKKDGFSNRTIFYATAAHFLKNSRYLIMLPLYMPAKFNERQRYIWWLYFLRHAPGGLAQILHDWKMIGVNATIAERDKKLNEVPKVEEVKD